MACLVKQAQQLWVLHRSGITVARQCQGEYWIDVDCARRKDKGRKKEGGEAQTK